MERQSCRGEGVAKGRCLFFEGFMRVCREIMLAVDVGIFHGSLFAILQTSPQNTSTRSSVLPLGYLSLLVELEAVHLRMSQTQLEEEAPD